MIVSARFKILTNCYRRDWTQRIPAIEDRLLQSLVRTGPRFRPLSQASNGTRGEKRVDLQVIIVDDDAEHLALLSEYLKGYGMGITTFADGQGVLEALADVKPDVVILDIVLPRKSGLEILTEIRRTSDVPVIMLSAKGEHEDRIVGLELGADDYLPKPFNPRELLARIKAVVRRRKPVRSDKEAEKMEGIVQAGGLLLDVMKLTLLCGEAAEELSWTECRILRPLMERPGRVFSREALLDAVYGSEVSGYDRSIDVHISRLRTKIERVSGRRNRIRTARGMGYYFAEQP